MANESVSVLAPTFAVDVKPGGEFRVGEAIVKRRLDGFVEACDSHGCVGAAVPPGRDVQVHPVPAVHRLLDGIEHIYIEFESKLYAHNGGVYWTLAPYELEVSVDDTVIGRVSPVRVKFTLIGDVTDGIIARYHRAPVAYRVNDLPVQPGLAAVAFKVTTGLAMIPGVGFHASDAPLYVDSQGVIYYPLVEVELSDNVMETRVAERPPVEGARALLLVRRWLLALHQAEPFKMVVASTRKRMYPTS